MRLYIAGDTGPSGFGEATRGIVNELVNYDEFDINFRTHHWGWNKYGLQIQSDMIMPDHRFRERLIREGIVNEDYLLQSPNNPEEQMAKRNTNLMGNLNVSESKDLMIRDWAGDPDEADIWYANGGVNFAEQAPSEPGEPPYTILHTDYNLDIVPRQWEHFIPMVDEVWVPSQWTKQAILNRMPDANVHSMPYGVNQRYKPGDYDHELCPSQHQSRSPERQHCLDDDKFTFCVISRFYHIKGLYRTIKAFIEEFTDDEPVRLMVKTTSNNQFDFNPKATMEQLVTELAYPDIPEIGLRVNPLDHQRMYDFLGHIDCFIQASRAECFGIAQVEAAWCETPVIATNWSSQREVWEGGERGVRLLTDYELEKPEPETNSIMYEGGDSYPPDSKWAVNSVDEIMEAMREIYELSPDQRAEMGRYAHLHAKENYAWEDRIKPRVERFREVTP